MTAAESRAEDHGPGHRPGDHPRAGRRVVLTSFGSYGDVYPFLGIALGLKARGHEPVLAAPAHYREMVEGEGLAFRPVRPDVDPNDRETIARIMDAARGTEFLLREVLVPALRESYEDLLDASRGADLLVTHPITFAGPMVAERLAIPWVSTVLAPMSFFSAHDLPAFPPAPWLKRLEVVPGVARGLVRFSKRLVRPWTRPIDALRAELGLAPTPANPVFEGQHSPWRVLALFSEVLASPRPDWPEHVRVAGGVRYHGPAGEQPLPPGLRRFLEAGPAPVVFTLGTSAVGAAGSFYAESVRAVRTLGVRAVLLTGGLPENEDVGPLPEGVHLEGFASHAALFPHASVIVHQGGAGTAHRALEAGRPTLVVPHAHDQADNAWRLERLGVSLTVSPRRYRARRVAAALGRLLGESRFTDRAAALRARVLAENAVGTACDEIEAILAGADTA